MTGRYAALALVSLLSLGAGVGGGLLHDDGRIDAGVRCAGLPLGGRTVDEAAADLERELAARLPERLELRLGDRAWTFTNAQIGRRVRCDLAAQAAFDHTRQGNWVARGRARWRTAHQGATLPVPVEVDAERLQAAVAGLAAEIDRAPANARVVEIIDERLYLAPEQDGLALDVAASVAAARGDGRFPAPAEVDLAVRRVPAQWALVDLRDRLNTRLAAYTTSMAHGYYGAQRRNRSHNVRLCLARMNGLVLGPGEEFSFNDRLGERRAEDGFRSSYTFRRKPDGTVEERWETGGGICQLASTLFNTVLYANLTVTERRPHSKPVHYARLGRDATVYFGVVDLKFRNSLSEPVMLWGELDDDLDLTISIWGDESDDVEVDLETEPWYGRLGPGAELYRTVKGLDGAVKVPRTHLFSSAYRSGE